MPPKIYTIHISQPARAVSWACSYEGTAVEEVQIMPGKDTVTAEYKKRNPIGTVPRLEEEDGFILNESHAIMCYLGDKFDWKLYPREPRARARVHQYLHWHNLHARRITLSLFAPVLRPDFGIPKDTIEYYKQSIAPTLATIEQWLTESRWLCVDEPTVADISCYCEVGQCQDHHLGLFGIFGLSLEPYPRVREWLRACEQLPGYEKSHALVAKMAPGIKKKASALAAKL